MSSIRSCSPGDRLSTHVAELLYQHGILDRTRSFETLSREALINDRALAADRDPAFSLRIREGMPAS